MLADLLYLQILQIEPFNHCGAPASRLHPNKTLKHDFDIQSVSSLSFDDN